MKKINKKNIKPIAAIGIMALLILGGIYLFLVREKQKGSTIDNGTYLPKAADEEVSEGSEREQSDETDKVTTPAAVQTVLTIKTPAEGDVVTTNRTLSGTAQNVGTSIEYKLYGEAAGDLASGTITLADNSSKEVSFSTQFSFLRKPSEGDTGFLIFYSGSGSAKKEIKRIGVNF